MLIGLISDTHIPVAAKGLPQQIREVFAGVDLILHAGDVYTVSVLDELETIAPILVSQGDDDRPEVLADKRVAERQVIKVCGTTIWLTHIKPWAFPFDLQGSPSAGNLKYEKLPDIFVVGHSHECGVEKVRDTMVISPGSATFPKYKQELGTVALLTLDSCDPVIKIIQLK